MKNKICCFAGHSIIYNQDELFDRVKTLAEKLITEENVSEFRVGNYGDFDRLSAGAIRRLKETYSHVRLNLVIPICDRGHKPIQRNVLPEL